MQTAASDVDVHQALPRIGEIPIVELQLPLCPPLSSIAAADFLVKLLNRLELAVVNTNDTPSL